MARFIVSSCPFLPTNSTNDAPSTNSANRFCQSAEPTRQHRQESTTVLCSAFSTRFHATSVHTFDIAYHAVPPLRLLLYVRALRARLLAPSPPPPPWSRPQPRPQPWLPGLHPVHAAPAMPSPHPLSLLDALPPLDRVLPLQLVLPDTAPRRPLPHPAHQRLREDDFSGWKEFHSVLLPSTYTIESLPARRSPGSSRRAAVCCMWDRSQSFHLPSPSPLFAPEQD